MNRWGQDSTFRVCAGLQSIAELWAGFPKMGLPPGLGFKENGSYSEGKSNGKGNLRCGMQWALGVYGGWAFPKLGVPFGVLKSTGL